MNTLYQLKFDVVLQTAKQAEGEGLLIRLMTEDRFPLSVRSLDIVQELLKNQDEAKVSEVLAEKYEVAVGEIAPEVAALVAQLSEAELLGVVCCTGGACGS